MGLKLNGRHLLLACADEVNLLGDSVNAIKKKAQTFSNDIPQVLGNN
jgi:hypothetical protein